MDALDYARAIRRRALLIIAVTIACTTFAVANVQGSQPAYQSQAQFFVSGSRTSPDVSTAYTSTQLVQQRVTSYVAVVTSTTVTKKVVDALHLSTSPQQLSQQLSAENPDGTGLINATVTASSPREAQALMRAVSRQFIRVIHTLEPSTKAGNGTFRSGSDALVRVTVIRQPTRPEAPSGLSSGLKIAGGVLVGLMIGVGSAVLGHKLDRTLREPDEVQRALNLPVLGIVPRLTARRPGTEGPRRIEAAFADAYRRIRTTLMSRTNDTPVTLLVTGAVCGEGASTTALHLASAVAELERRVVIVEADLRHPSLAQRIGQLGGPTIADVLEGRHSLDDALHRVRPGLLALVAPLENRPDAAKLLGSRAMTQMMSRLALVADVIIIDAPPVLESADAETVAPLTSEAVVVARWGRTPRESIAATTRALDTVGIPVEGIVLNDARGTRLPRPRRIRESLIPLVGPDTSYQETKATSSATSRPAWEPHHVDVRPAPRVTQESTKS